MAIPVNPRLRRLRRLFDVVAIAVGVVTLPIALPVFWVQAVGHSRVVPASDVPEVDAVVVLGAGLRDDGTPSTYLRRRVEAGAALYRSGRAEQVILSGDAHTLPDGKLYDEPGSMRAYALTLGVPDEVLVLDREGFDTDATCRRARDEYGVRTAVVVTQDFHLRRTLFTCGYAGLDAVGVGVSSQSVTPVKAFFAWKLREIPASWKAAAESFLRR
ncbi:vancomycin high temperature exclusion protein [Myceligenerans pegani]|uniref:YdcF family protein n=1 Tax=Myceligenerans pegani TaxID=2776917 RepID=A0ABR9MSM1_9MICO|nr:ElyC/SanA/YdcF family protein [Myceligenerans sp. TRM 65318]MBE1874349.1 YdcF family protein [Myceligenerans sp. TRM 65318]MBE3016620.1 YdcF family protein [Myceligenerans sp. TRM 65318]